MAAIHGVDYYNDSKATNVDATAKAIASFPGNIHLILEVKTRTRTTPSSMLSCGAGQSGLHHRFGGRKDRKADFRRVTRSFIPVRWRPRSTRRLARR